MIINISIHILCSQTAAISTVVPANGTSISDVYIGLIQQYHFVILESNNSINGPSEIGNDNKELNDSIIEEGDEHTRQITGGPLESLLCIENPEADAHIYSVAPAEGEKPLFIMNDAHFEEMSNPDKYPFGIGGYNTNRDRKITCRKYYNQRLLDVDRRFACDLDYLFVAQYIVEAA